MQSVCFIVSLRNNVLTLVELYSPNKCVKNHIRASGIIHSVHANAKVKDTYLFLFCLSVAHISLDLYMSESSRVMGTFPMVFLKNTSSMVDGPTERRAGKSNSSFPKRHG